MKVHTYGKSLAEMFTDRLQELLEAEEECMVNGTEMPEEELEEMDWLSEFNDVYMEFLLKEHEVTEFYKSQGVEFVWD